MGATGPPPPVDPHRPIYRVHQTPDGWTVETTGVPGHPNYGHHQITVEANGMVEVIARA